MPNRQMFRLRYSAPRMAAGSDEAEVKLYGEIITGMPEDWKWDKEDKSASDFDAAIKKAITDGARNLLLRINSPGGYVKEAVAMRSTLVTAGFEKIKIRIEGLCASAATILATIPGAHVQIARGSEYMIHNALTWGFGNANDLSEIVESLQRTDADLREFYVERTGKTDEEVKAWMDAERWFTAKEAVENGFADEILPEEKDIPAVACVSASAMNAMRGMYKHIPEAITVSNESPTVAVGDPTEIKKSEQEEETMDIKDITKEALKNENPELFSTVTEEAVKAERQRIQDITDLTIEGYEELAEAAKADGTSVMEFQKKLAAAQREKRKKFLTDRKNELSAAEKVKGGAHTDNDDSDDTKADAYAKELAGYAKEFAGNSYESMF